MTHDVLILLKSPSSSTPAAGYVCSRNSRLHVMWAIVDRPWREVGVVDHTHDDDGNVPR